MVQLKEDIAATGSETKPKRLTKRVKLVEAFLESGNRPAWMVMTVLPVLPPDLRPLEPLARGRVATPDLTGPSRPPIHRTHRLRLLHALNQPHPHLHNEQPNN